MKLEFPRRIFSQNAQIPNFMRIHPVRAELFHAMGQTDGQTGQSLFAILRIRLKTLATVRIFSAAFGLIAMTA
jgi:hypothetical protein